LDSFGIIFFVSCNNTRFQICPLNLGIFFNLIFLKILSGFLRVSSKNLGFRFGCDIVIRPDGDNTTLS